MTLWTELQNTSSFNLEDIDIKIGDHKRVIWQVRDLLYETIINNNDNSMDLCVYYVYADNDSIKKKLVLMIDKFTETDEEALKDYSVYDIMAYFTHSPEDELFFQNSEIYLKCFEE